MIRAKSLVAMKVFPDPRSNLRRDRQMAPEATSRWSQGLLHPHPGPWDDLDVVSVTTWRSQKRPLHTNLEFRQDSTVSQALFPVQAPQNQPIPGLIPRMMVNPLVDYPLPQTMPLIKNSHTNDRTFAFLNHSREHANSTWNRMVSIVDEYLKIHTDHQSTEL